MPAQGRPADALALLEKTLKEFPSDYEARLARVSFWLDLNGNAKAGAAVKELDQLRAIRPDDSALYYALGRAELLAGHTAEADEYWTRASGMAPRFKEPRISLAELYLSQGKGAAAQRYTEEALKLDPGDSRVQLLHASAMMTNNRLPDAASELNSILKTNPGNEEARINLALVYLAQKRLPEAQSLFNKLYRPGNKDLRALTGLVQIYVSQGQAQRAIDLIADELKHAADPAGVKRLLAQTALAANQPDVSIRQYSDLVQTNPRSVPDQYRLAMAYTAKGDTTSAIANLQSAEHMKPDDPAVMSMLAFQLLQSGRKQESLAEFRRVLELRPDDPNTMNNVAYLMEETGGNLDEALRLVKRALRGIPNEPSYLDTEGIIYLKKKMSDMALQTIGKAVRRAPGDPSYLYHLAMAQVDSGDRIQARATLRTALGKKPPKAVEAGIRQLLGRIGQGA